LTPRRPAYARRRRRDGRVATTKGRGDDRTLFVTKELGGIGLMAVSVCIPVYKRHDLLVECVQSIFDTSIRPLEVVVSDDGHEPELAARLAELTPPPGIDVRYVENSLERGEFSNIYNAFREARYDLLVLMHDDDYFLPGGLDSLWSAWIASEDQVDAVFGRQLIVDVAGNYMPDLDRRWNKQHRHLDQAGLTPSNLWSALKQQFPMNGMMVRRALALEAHRPLGTEVVGSADLHFAVRYATAAERSFLFIDVPVSAYRQTPQSVSRARGSLNLDGHLNYEMIEALAPRDGIDREARRYGLVRMANSAVLAYLARGQRRRALKVYARHAFRMRAPLLSRLKLALLLGGSLLGVNWPEDVLRRRRLGLPQWRGPFMS